MVRLGTFPRGKYKGAQLAHLMLTVLTDTGVPHGCGNHDGVSVVSGLGVSFFCHEEV